MAIFVCVSLIHMQMLGIDTAEKKKNQIRAKHKPETLQV